MKISAIVLSKNAEDSIGRCLASLSFCDEIILVDDGSTDRTVAIAQQYKTTVLKRRLDGDFSAQRSYGESHASGDWLIHLDADEVLTPDLTRELLIKINEHDNPVAAYQIRRRDFFLSRKISHGEISSAHRCGLIRLMKKNSGKWQGKVHETYITGQPVKRLNAFIDHYPHKNITNFLQKINNYSTIRAEELYEQGRRTGISEIMVVPPAKFVYTYFMKLGFLDGPGGFIYSFIMSFHSFLVRAKLYLKMYAKKG